LRKAKSFFGDSGDAALQLFPHPKILLCVSDGKHSSNINDVFRSEQKSQFETKSNWPTDDSFSGAGELGNFLKI
jgi:hypothetical protein